MKQIRHIAIYFSVLFTIQAIAQVKSTRFTIPKAATINAADIKEDWNPVIQNIEMPTPDGKSEKQKLNAIKDSLSRVYPKKHIALKSENKMPAPPAPFLGQKIHPPLAKFYECFQC